MVFAAESPDMVNMPRTVYPESVDGICIVGESVGTSDGTSVVGALVVGALVVGAPVSNQIEVGDIN